MFWFSGMYIFDCRKKIYMKLTFRWDLYRLWERECMVWLAGLMSCLMGGKLEIELICCLPLRMNYKFHMSSNKNATPLICSTVQRWLTTAPGAPTTHWYQLRCVLSQPIYVMAGQEITGRLRMVAHSAQSYTIYLTLSGWLDIISYTFFYLNFAFDWQNLYY